MCMHLYGVQKELIDCFCVNVVCWSWSGCSVNILFFYNVFISSWCYKMFEGLVKVA